MSEHAPQTPVGFEERSSGLLVPESMEPSRVDAVPEVGRPESPEDEVARVEGARAEVENAFDEEDQAPGRSEDDTEIIDDADPTESSPELDDHFEAVAAKRESIQKRIDEADKISSKKARLDALKAIAEENMQEQGDGVDNVDNFTFPDLAIEAAVRMKDSKHHQGFNKWRLGRTKKAGVVNSMRNDLLKDISNANPDSMLGVEAALKIDMPWLRHETLLGVGQNALTKLYSLQELVSQSQLSGGGPDEQALFELNKYTHIVESVKSEIKGWHSWKYNHVFDASIAAHSMGPAYLDVVSNFHFHKKQKALYDMAVNERDEEIAADIKYPWLKRKALNEIRKLNSIGS